MSIFSLYRDITSHDIYADSDMVEAAQSDPGAKVDMRRFAALLSEDSCPRPPYDQVLFELSGCVVTPTLGSILPYWLLVVPRASFMNFVQWRAETRVEPHQLVRDVLAQIGVQNNRAIWFEHGPAARGSSLGCGVDHAHLHVVVDAPITFQDFVSAVKNAAPVVWHKRSAAHAHRSIVDGASYLMAASINRAVVAENVENVVGSQFFRRVIAGLVGRPQAWNYKTHPHIENARKTLSAFDIHARHDAPISERRA